MGNMCIFIPTYNRPDCIQEWLRAIEKSIETNNMDIYISDTSEEDDTEIVVKAYNEKAKKKIGYIHIHDYPDKTTDLKVAEGFTLLRDKYEFIYLCGDGLIVDLNALKGIFTENGYDWDAMHFYASLENNACSFSSGKDFAYTCGWFATYYGATIFNSKLLKTVDFDSLLEKYRNTGFLVWEAMFSSLASDDVKIICIKKFPVNDNPNKKTNSSYQPKRFMTFWVTNWMKVVDDLPTYYDDIKDYLRKDVGNKLKLYSFSNLVRLRLSNNLDKEIFYKFKSDLPRVTDRNLSFIHLVAIAPIGILKFFFNLRKELAKIYHKIN